jgi:DNA/RNA-binding domain of Phe-tRNA-synthetase-like protein
MVVGVREMQITVQWSSEVSARLPELAICIGIINGIKPEKDNSELHKLKEVVYKEVRAEYTVEVLKDNPVVRIYRDFYWKLGVDPTKTRPSGEALLRRVLHGNELPNISTVVDAYNLASLKTVIPISGFDSDRVSPPFEVRFGKDDEVFVGIDMDKPMPLTGKTLVLADKNRVLCIYPYRDSDYTKIGMQTRNAIIVGYGASGIAENQLKEAVETTLSFIEQFSDGEIELVKVFKP